MGLLGDALKRLTAAGGATASTAPIPDLDRLVTAGEIEAVTGAAPVGEPRRNGPSGSEVDVGGSRSWTTATSS